MEIDNEELMKAIAQMQAEGKLRVIGETVILSDAPEGTAEKAFEGMGLVFAFTDQSPSYTSGFEAGMIYQRIQSGEPSIDCGYLEGFPIHTENLETIGRMAAASGYALETQDTGYDGWTSVRLFKSTKPRLSVVENSRGTD